ncbi:MAG: hypothetical protein ACD_23C00120G0002 [uncultured bacterium]|nr:MAG: hypothetical protein ACD_23C00120G0002 [uncultured bacterium]
MPRSLARGTFLTKLHCSESGEMKVRYRADRRPAVQRLRVLVNGRNMEVPRTANQEPLVKFGIVPIADSHDLEDRSFIAVVQDAEAVTQITVSFSLNWPALEQRERVYRNSNCQSNTGHWRQ